MARFGIYGPSQTAGTWMVGLIALISLAGCASTTGETAGIRTRIETGIVALGSSTASVVSMLGNPHLRLAKEGDPRGTESWVYIERRIEKAGTVTVGRFETLYDRESRIYTHFIIPEDRDRFVSRAHVVAVFTFEAGKLVSIEFPTETGSVQLPPTSGPKA